MIQLQKLHLIKLKVGVTMINISQVNTRMFARRALKSTKHVNEQSAMLQMERLNISCTLISMMLWLSKLRKRVI